MQARGYLISVTHAAIEILHGPRIKYTIEVHHYCRHLAYACFYIHIYALIYTGNRRIS